MSLDREEKVLIIMPDTIEAVIAFLGTVRMGIAALINFKLTKDDYLYAANLSGLGYLLLMRCISIWL
ncbi:MAG: hypothetical protein ACP5GY_06300 [Vulcanisaeta sp.]